MRALLSLPVGFLSLLRGAQEEIRSLINVLANLDKQRKTVTSQRVRASSNERDLVDEQL